MSFGKFHEARGRRTGSYMARGLSRVLLWVAIPVLLCESMLSAQSASSLAGQRRSVPVAFAGSGSIHSESPCFTANLGQWPAPARFVAQRRWSVLRAEPTGVWMELMRPSGRPDVFDRLVTRLTFVDALPDVEVIGEGREPFSRNYFLGSDPARWRSDVPVYAALRWKNVWPGIDFLLLPGSQGEVLRYELELAAGADASRIAFDLEGASGLSSFPTGALIAQTPLGDLTMTRPRSFQGELGGGQRELPTEFQPLQGVRFTLRIDDLDASQPARIDPGLTWASYLGGSFDDMAVTATVGTLDRPVIAGWTWALDFPTTVGAFQLVKAGDADVFVTVLRPDGSGIVSSTYLGGDKYDVPASIKMTPDGSMVVAGFSQSSNFPTTPGAFKTTSVSPDGFVVRLSELGGQMQFSTFVGGAGAYGDSVSGLAVAADGNLWLCGNTNDPGFPGTAGSVFPSPSAFGDCWVGKLSIDGSTLLWATYLGGSGGETPTRSIAATPDGGVIVAGDTYSPDFPTTPLAFDPVFDPGVVGTGFVSKFNSTGTALVYSTFLHGGLGSSIHAIDGDASGRVALVGLAYTGFPVTPGAFDTVLDGTSNEFVAVLDVAGANLEWSSFLGTKFFDSQGGAAVELSDSGELTVMGSSYTVYYPVTPGSIPSPPGGRDFYVAKFRPGGSDLLYASFVGGSTNDLLFGGAVDSQGRALLVGSSCCAPGFPVTPGAFDTSYGGHGPSSFYGDGVVAKLELQPQGVSAFGSPTSACLGATRLTALGEAKAGNGGFRIACVGAPANALGILAVGGGSFPAGVPLIGVIAYVDVFAGALLLPAAADATGFASVPTPLPPTAGGVTVYVQAGWVDTGGCGGTLAFSSSDALMIQVQP
jgi:hypothetical protein